MSHIAVSNLAYAHPGGDLLFEGVSFNLAPGEHVGLVGANGVGKSTLLKILAGDLPAEEGEAATGGRAAYMPQDVGLDSDDKTVRDLLTALAPHALKRAGTKMAAAERALDEGDPHAGVDLGTAIGEWPELGGDELEAQWDRATRRLARDPPAE